MHIGYRYTIEWFTPYENPPDGLPRVKAEMYETLNHRRERMLTQGEPFVPQWFKDLKTIGDHYMITVQAIMTPSKQLSQSTLARVRIGRLTRRIRAKYPLFAEQMIAQAMAEKPAYYSGITDQHIQDEHDAAIDREVDIYQRFCAATGVSDV